MSAQELYSEKGKLLHADMPKVLQALQMVGGVNFSGYLIVVDVPTNEKKPVALETIETVVANRPMKNGCDCEKVSSQAPSFCANA